ncbi:MAG: hypothetical protein AAGF93_16605 [Cyanobacteria bacterium P01_H01_bin.105]
MPRRLYYFLLSLALTGVLASVEARSSFVAQQHLNRQQSIDLFWDYTGLPDLIAQP